MADDRLIPGSVNDASAHAYNEMAERLGTLDVTVLLVYMIDLVPSPALPHLAEQFRVTSFEWRLAQTDIERRDLIKHAIERRRHSGTPYAIEKGLELLNLTGKVSEWFEYGGEPGYFRVEIDLLTRGLDMVTQDLLEKMIETYKRKSSWMEPILMRLTNRSKVYMGAALTTGERTTVYPWGPTTLELHAPLQVGIGYQSVETITVYPLPA